MRKNSLTLNPVEDSDICILNKWLNKEHVLKWYHDADEWMYEIKERNGEFSFLTHYIVSVDGLPIGFCQHYDCFDAKEEWYDIEQAGRTFSIDYFIGEEAYLKKGYGKAIVKELVSVILNTKNPDAIIVLPEDENIASIKSLLSNGFKFDTDKEYYILDFNETN